jgi:hypothetical protein
MQFDRSPADQIDPMDSSAPQSRLVSADLNRALALVVRHQAAKTRYFALVAEYHAARNAQWDLVEDSRRQREYTELALMHMRSLRGAVRDYVVELRATEVPPERMVRLVKAALADVMDATPVIDRPADPRRIQEQIVEWAIGEYYAA